MKKNKGFEYYISEEMLAAYRKKPAGLRLDWVYAGNILRQAYPEKLRKLQDRGRGAGVRS